MVGSAAALHRGGPRFEALDSLRGLCACGVVLYHLHSAGTIANLPLFWNGPMFVDFFFVLSGFVIAASYGERLRSGFPLRAFMLMRLGRIYPLHLLMLLLFLALETVRIASHAQGLTPGEPFTGDRSLPAWFESLLLVQIFVPGDGPAWNAPSWSIAAEMWTYLLAGCGLVLLKGRLRIALAVLAAALTLLIVLSRDLSDYFMWSFGRCLFGFALGMLAFDFRRAFWRLLPSGAAAATLVESAVLATVVAFMSFVRSEPLASLCPLLFVCVVLVVAREQGAASRLLRTAPLRLLGTLSYSIYMVHWLLIVLFMNLLAHGGRLFGARLLTPGEWHGQESMLIDGGGVVPDLLTLAFLALVIGTAAVTHRFVEAPLRELSRRRAERIAGRSVAPLERLAPTM